MNSDKKKKISLWKELQRRHVLRTIAIYAPAAFILLELVDIITPALSLPPWTVTLTVIILAAGFPVIVILAWIFDITPEGVKKTDSIDKSFEVISSEGLKRRKLRVSDAIITALIIVVCILVYPKIFNRDQLRKVRDEDGRLSLIVSPFENMTSDTLLNVWEKGLQNLMITALSNSAELSVRQYEQTSSVIDSRSKNYASLSPELFRDVADKLEARTLIRGSFMKAGNEVRMDAQLIDTESDEIYQTFKVHGVSENDFFAMADSITALIKNFVEIKNIKEKRNSSIIKAEQYMGNSEAFKYFMHGVDALFDLNYEEAIEWLGKAVETDSSFIKAQVYMAYAYHSMDNDIMAKPLIVRIYQEKDNLPITDRLLLEHLHAYFFETPYEEMKYARQLVEIDRMNPTYWHMLGFAHYKVHEYEKALSTWEEIFKLHEKWEMVYENPFTYFLMGDAYHQLGETEKEGEILELGLELFPDNWYILIYRATWALTQNDPDLANQIIEDYFSYRRNVTHCPEALISNDVGDIFANAGLLDEAEEQFRDAVQRAPENLQFRFNLAKFLIDNEVNIDEGIEIVDLLLARFPDHWNLLNYKGWGLYKVGKIAEAVKFLRLAWEKKPIYNHFLYLRLQEAEKEVRSLN